MNNLITKNNDNFKNTFKSYVIGFILCVVLTIIPFYIVHKKTFSITNIVLIVLLCAILQIFVHLKYFLHLHTTKENNWSMMFFIFAMIIILIIFFGSIWIMYNLKSHMLCFICI